MTADTPSPASAPSTIKRPLLIGGAIALVIVCLCCLLAVAIVALDPFGWNLLGFLFGRGDPLAASMPADTLLYISVDITQATPEKLNRVVQPFQDALGVEEKIDLDRLKEEIDNSLLSGLDMTFKEDIEPWIGQYIAFGMKNIQMDYASSGEMPSFLLALETRNSGKADEFLLKLKEESLTAGGDTIQETTYQDVTIFFSTPTYGQGMAFARSGNAILIATTAKDIQDAIDAQKGDSLADIADYKETIGALPSGRILTIYMDYGNFLESYLSTLDTMTQSALPGTGLDIAQMDLFTKAIEDSSSQMGGMAMGLRIVDAGIQMDAAMVTDTGDLTPEQKAIAEKSGPAKDVITLLPEDTFLFIAGKYPNEGWTSVRTSLIGTGLATASDYDEAMQSFEQVTGVNPETDIFPYLGGEVAVAAFPSSSGLLAESIGTDLGAVALLETNNGDAALETIGKLVPTFEELGLPLDRKEAEGLTYYEGVDPSTQTSAFALGVGGKYFLLGSNGQILEDVHTRKTSLSDSSQYQQAVKALPGGMSPVMYLDFQGLLNVVRGSMSGSTLRNFNETMRSIDPITALILGTAPQRGRLATMSYVLIMEPVK